MNICRERHVTSVNVERSACEAAALVCRLKRLTVMSAAHYLVSRVTCTMYVMQLLATYAVMGNYF